MIGITARPNRNVPRVLTSKVRSKSATDSSRPAVGSVGTQMPALLTRMSMPPRLATVSSTTRHTSVGSLTSATYTEAATPYCSISERGHGAHLGLDVAQGQCCALGGQRLGEAAARTPQRPR